MTSSPKRGERRRREKERRRDEGVVQRQVITTVSLASILICETGLIFFCPAHMLRIHSIMFPPFYLFSLLFFSVKQYQWCFLKIIIKKNYLQSHNIQKMMRVVGAEKTVSYGKCI